MRARAASERGDAFLPLPLSEIEVRVLGALIEKDMTTPEYYPLSLNALVNACNQKSNRNPVAGYDERTAARAIESLREKKLALVLTGREHRVPKYRHWAWETLGLGPREMAVLCALMLRGPQSVGELKGRTQRMYNFDDLASVEVCLDHLIERRPQPLVTKLARQPGTREPRYAHLLSGEVQAPEPEAQPAPVQTLAPKEASADRIAKLESDVDELRSEVLELKEQLSDFRKQFE